MKFEKRTLHWKTKILTGELKRKEEGVAERGGGNIVFTKRAHVGETLQWSWLMKLINEADEVHEAD